ncbi:hypothetical protein C8A05DRAFT_16886 [Staphylotrichum tortipilum]|uniref:LRR-containing protein second PH domain-containing protein n=1 Tax=Staphylotrichum tortipilum TaxID=2831512 RepID=A0AAN6MHB3_9PEZI|nr:hypothetical protein C8A05DRAFT_16886 [Staphylotrichum longicolle]
MASTDPMVKKRPAILASRFSRSNSPDPYSGPSTTVPSPRNSVEGGHRAFSIESLKRRTWRSFSSSSKNQDGSLRPDARKLSKSRPLSTASSQIGPPSRRDSAISDGPDRLSLSTADRLSIASASLVSSASSCSPSIDWKAQRVEGLAPLETESVLLKIKAPYLVVTTNYLVKTKSRADAAALFPELATGGVSPDANGSAPEPMLVIPTEAVVSVFAAESPRPASGIEVWWKNPLAGSSLCRSDVFFANPTDRNEQLHHITRAMRANTQDDDSPGRPSQTVEALLRKTAEAEEPKLDRKPDIFPVVPRGNTRREYMPKIEDATKKPQEGPALYLVVGTYLCHLVEIQQGKGGKPVCRHKTYGMVALESFRGEWILHEERFNITFRDPFKPPVTLELASRDYRAIIRAFGIADRFLKPAWPQLWQSMEIFHVSGLKEPQYLVPKEDFGSFKRTLDAYLAAYRCADLEWVINWRTRYAPEFRLLPPAKGGQYAPLQLLAVLRALRYNDYFNSLSFRDVDLSVLYGLEDSTPRRVNVAYLSRTCVALGPDEIETLRTSPALHQEFHALAFCSETIRQIDLGNCSRSLASRLEKQGGQVSSLQFLTPILSLLRSGITKCNRLIVDNNVLPRADVDDLAETMMSGAIQALDVSNCGLDDTSLRDMIVAPLTEYPGLLQALSISGNPGRLPAHVLPGLLECLLEIRELNLSGSIQAESYVEHSLLPFEVLECMERLEVLDISGYKLDEETFLSLERFLDYRAWRHAQDHPLRFHTLHLNNCHITGALAARLFHAIGPAHALHLSLNSNPLETSLPHLTAAMALPLGPSSLSLEMLDLRHEQSYLSLLTSLTPSQHLTRLSLAGTSPPHSSSRSPLPATLHAFLAENRSITHLNLSSFSSRLSDDDGHLPAAALASALAGLEENTTLTHLRLRNQRYFHAAAGALGNALRTNSTLRSVNCTGVGGLNLTSLSFLVQCLKDGPGGVVEFGVDTEGVWNGIVRELRTGKGSGTAGREKEEGVLRGVLKSLVGELEGVLEGHRAAAAAAGEGVMTPGVQRHRHTRSGSNLAGLFGGSGEDEGWMAFEGGGVGSGGGRFGGGPSRSPAETLDPVSEAETPVEEGLQQEYHLVGEGEIAEAATLLGQVVEEEGDEVFRKMVSDFRRAGFDV